MPLGNGAKQPKKEEYLVRLDWYACDGEERWCPDCAKTGKQYAAIYKLSVINGEPRVEYFGIVVRCKDCRLHVYFDPEHNEVRRNYVNKEI